MNILITAGSTCVQIDQVRVISNIFKGRTGIEIARAAANMGHRVTLLTSRGIGATSQLLREPLSPSHAITLCGFRTFDELSVLMEQKIRGEKFDAIIHSAAVSDYKVASVRDGGRMLDADETGSKIGSGHGSLWLELVPTEKLVDKIRPVWGFKGTLVKFKLQVGIPDDELITIARKSRRDSEADIIVANCLEWAKEYAYIIGANDQAERVTRETLPYVLLRRLS
ncbi:MAG: phosphopantothenoylcysteine decarboxylase [Patescibacteria group bacterium]